MRKKQWNKIVAAVMAAAMVFCNGFGISNPALQVKAAEATYVDVDDAALDAALADVGETLGFFRQAVHDPSIVVDGENYYVFGSHMAVAKTTDLRNWSYVTGEREDSTLFGKVNTDGTVTPVSYNEAFRVNAYTGPIQTATSSGSALTISAYENVSDTFVNQPTATSTSSALTSMFGTYDASAWNTAVDNFKVQGNMWAPDVVYNETMGKWCMYLSLNGNKWNSVIILLTADELEGPYVYQGPVLYSGFNGKNPVDHMDTDLKFVYPDIATTGLPEKYKVGDSWGTLWPHAIDPCVSYDEDGNLWLIYGSWSGGIYAIELDEETGLRDYTVEYPDIDAGVAKVTSDAYFGTKIAGGAYVSGEGAYVEKIGNYWFLFMSYGFYSPDGGYEMRIFRSDNINGPYVDANGESAIFPSYKMNYGSGIKAYNGDKLMGGYQWETMSLGELSQGHNSAFTDADGNTYVVYHTKFNDGTATHALRVHQLYLNENDWLVAAPYEYTGETVNNDTLASTAFEASEIAGEYQVILHKYEMDYAKMEIVKPETITLTADGKVSGAYTGTWAVSNGSYVTVTLDGTAYQGVLVEQTIDGTPYKTLCFTAQSNKGVSVWGSRALDGKLAIAMTRDALGLSDANNIFPIGGEVYQNITLPTTGKQGAVVTWTSSNTAVLGNDGVVTVPAENTKVTMTCTITKDGYRYQKSFDLMVMGSAGDVDLTDGLVAKFEFEDGFKDSLSDAAGTAEAQEKGTAPSIKKDVDLDSSVVQVNFGFDGESTSNYVKFANPLKGNTTGEATISMLVKRGDTDVWDALWGFMDTDASDGVDGRYYLTGNAYVGFNGTGGWFDANHSETVTNAIPVGEWSLVTVTADGEGFDIYIDGALVYNETHTAAFGSSEGFADYSCVTKLLASADTFYLGYGSWWGSAPFKADDLCFYNRVLTAADVSALYDEFQEKLEDAKTEDGELRDVEGYRTYFNDFEAGLGDATVVGSGEVETVENEFFNQVYHNATGEAGVRKNYLLLPSDTIKNATSTGSNEMTVGFWVNVADAASYFYSPMFMAYGDAPNAETGENSWPVLALQSRLLAQLNCAGWTDFVVADNVAGVNQETTAWLDDKEWHYYTATFTEELVTIYVDGVVQNQWTLDGSDGHTVAGLFSNGADLDYVCLGGNQAWNWADNDASYMFDDVSLFSIALTKAEIDNLIAEKTNPEEEPEATPTPTPTPTPFPAPEEREDREAEAVEALRTYFNDFEAGYGDATQVGSGAIEEDADAHFGKIYHNATANAGVRTNYLLLPEDAIANAVAAGSKEMSIGFWVNVADATDYFWTPIFTAYGAAPVDGVNTWPVLALQSRLVAQLNCAGWTDFTDADNMAGANKMDTAWLDDKEWHYYTATFAENHVSIYVDGELQNQWYADGTDGHNAAGLFVGGADLKYVALGGNQAWDWADKDSSYTFDDIAIYSTVLSAGEIADIMEAKMADPEVTPTPVPTSTPTPVPTSTPTPVPTSTPTPVPTSTPTPVPTSTPTPVPTSTPTPVPTSTPTPVPTSTPTPVPTSTPTPVPTSTPTPVPTSTPTPTPTATPVPTATPIPGVVEVPTSGEKVVDKEGNSVSALVQDLATENKLVIAGVTDVEDAKVTWESTDTDVVEINENGEITMKNPGMTEIVVTVGEGEDARTETIVIVVEEEPEIKNDPLEAWKNVLLGPSKKDTTPARILLPGEKDDINFYGVHNWTKDKYEYIWESSDESVLATDNAGRITAKNAGTATLTLKLKNKATGNYLNVKSVEIVVPTSEENKIKLGTSKDNTFETLNLKQNERIDLNFYGVKNWKPGNYEYTWVSSDVTTVWVDQVGKLTPVLPGTATVTLVLVDKKTGVPEYVVPVEVTVSEK